MNLMDQHPLLASNVIPTNYKAGQVVIAQGDPGSEFFVIKSGTATVSIAQDDQAAQQVATLTAGDYFGEAALLRDEPRTATITAATNLS
ncbi:pkaR, partial [Symbiodinium pilosum]